MISITCDSVAMSLLCGLADGIMFPVQGLLSLSHLLYLRSWYVMPALHVESCNPHQRAAAAYYIPQVPGNDDGVQIIIGTRYIDC